MQLIQIIETGELAIFDPDISYLNSEKYICCGSNFVDDPGGIITVKHKEALSVLVYAEHIDILENLTLISIYSIQLRNLHNG